MKPVKVSFIDDAADEWERLNRSVAEEKSKGVENSENMRLLKSIKQKIELIKMNPSRGALCRRSSYRRGCLLIIYGSSI